MGPRTDGPHPSTLIETALHCQAVCWQTFMTVFVCFHPGPPSTLSPFCLGGVCSCSILLRFDLGVLVPSALFSCSISLANSCAGLTPSLTESRSFDMDEHFLHFGVEKPGLVTNTMWAVFRAKAQPHAEAHFDMGMLQSAFSTK